MSDSTRRFRLFLAYPAIVLGLFFVFDKLFLIEPIKLLTQDDSSYLIYDYKPELMKRVAEGEAARISGNAQRNKLLLVFGTSHLLYIRTDNFLARYPDWEIYNFSAPVNVPAYYVYVLERLHEMGVRPDYVIAEADPLQFNELNGVFAKPNIAYAFDLDFMLEYIDWDGDAQGAHVTRDEFSGWLARNLFAGYKYPPSPGNVVDRLTNPGQDRKFIVQVLQRDYQVEHRGAGMNLIPRENWYERDFARLEYGAANDFNWLLRRFALSHRQLDYLDIFVEKARAQGARVTLVRTPVSPPLVQKLKESAELTAAMPAWRNRIDTLVRENEATFFDLGEGPNGYECNTFVDASHMAIDCYEAMMVQVMDEYHRQVKSETATQE